MRRQLPPPESIREIQSIPTEFEKDDDSNHHIDFIAACANLRAEKYKFFFWVIASYGITKSDRNTIKKISGKIIPAISTTTAFVTGVIAVEAYKLMSGMKDLESYRSCFANLSMPFLCFTEPGPCARMKVGDEMFSEWDHLVLRKVGLKKGVNGRKMERHSMT